MLLMILHQTKFVPQNKKFKIQNITMSNIANVSNFNIMN